MVISYTLQMLTSSLIESCTCLIRITLDVHTLVVNRHNLQVGEGRVPYGRSQVVPHEHVQLLRRVAHAVEGESGEQAVDRLVLSGHAPEVDVAVGVLFEEPYEVL